MDRPQPVARDAFTRRFLARVPDVADSFTDAQLAAIRFAFGMRFQAAHRIDFRRRLRGFYVVLLAGNDRR